MMMRDGLIWFLGIIVLLTPVELGANDNKQMLKGRVIAKDAYVGLARLNSLGSVEVFIVRVEEEDPKKTSPRFIKIRYEDYGAKKKQPRDLFDGRVLWRFSASRDKSCDQIVSEDLFTTPNNTSRPPKGGTYVLLENVSSDLPKRQSLLPCFIVQPGGIKRLSAIGG